MPPALRERPDVPAGAAARNTSTVPAFTAELSGLVTVGRRGGR